MPLFFFVMSKRPQTLFVAVKDGDRYEAWIPPKEVEEKKERWEKDGWTVKIGPTI